MDRREFLRDAAGMLLVLPFGTFLLHCGKDETGSSSTELDDTPAALPPKVVGTNAIYTSNRISDHTHTFTVPLAAYESPPPGGIVGKTTEGGGHQHGLEVSVESLKRAQSGEIVKVESSQEAEHSHMFTLVKVG